jgi:hypothetical protein
MSALNAAARVLGSKWRKMQWRLRSRGHGASPELRVDVALGGNSCRRMLESGLGHSRIPCDSHAYEVATRSSRTFLDTSSMMTFADAKLPATKKRNGPKSLVAWIPVK